MTKEQRQFHERMNDEIVDSLERLKHEFDISSADTKSDSDDWQILRGAMKRLLLAAYARNHSWIDEAA